MEGTRSLRNATREVTRESKDGRKHNKIYQQYWQIPSHSMNTMATLETVTGTRSQEPEPMCEQCTEPEQSHVWSQCAELEPDEYLPRKRSLFFELKATLMQYTRNFHPSSAPLYFIYSDNPFSHHHHHHHIG